MSPDSRGGLPGFAGWAAQRDHWRFGLPVARGVVSGTVLGVAAVDRVGGGGGEGRL